MLESLLTFLFCCLMYMFMQTMRINRNQPIADHATPKLQTTAFVQNVQTTETQFCDHACQTVNECLSIGTQTKEQNVFDCASQTVDEFTLKHRSVQTLENSFRLQIPNSLQKPNAYFRFRHPFLPTPIFFPTNVQPNISRKISLKDISKNLLYIILEYAGGHYNFMLCDMKSYQFIKNMKKDVLDHLLKLYAMNVYYPWSSTYSLSNDGSALISKYTDYKGLKYDLPNFPVLLKYKNREFGLKYWVGEEFSYQSLSSEPELWINIIMQNEEVQYIIENEVRIKLYTYVLDPERSYVSISILFCSDALVSKLRMGEQKKLHLNDLRILPVPAKEMLVKIKESQKFYEKRIANYYM